MSMNPIVCLRTLVSQKKKRLIYQEYNLDLTYITNYVVAMGYPAQGTESTIRNKREDVIRFLKSKHGVAVKIYNLCMEPSH
jgi:phosphatidylinositol-3,4,5-trisphosphate 3-phosphatase and dual-specificity protein phosphatase PTEN